MRITARQLRVDSVVERLLPRVARAVTLGQFPSLPSHTPSRKAAVRLVANRTASLALKEKLFMSPAAACVRA